MRLSLTCIVALALASGAFAISDDSAVAPGYSTKPESSAPASSAPPEISTSADSSVPGSVPDTTDSSTTSGSSVVDNSTPVYGTSVPVSSATESSSSSSAEASPTLPAHCTWDQKQEFDQETWTPVVNYSYQPESSQIQAPGAIDKDILKMVRGLTLEEKVGQMTQIQVGQLMDCNGYLNMTAVDYWIDKYKVGSFLETAGNHGGRYSLYSAKQFANLTDSVQRVALAKGAKIPIIWGLDSVRGANYVKGAVIFPAGVATAATFNPQYAYDAGRIAAKDTRAAGVQWTFGPVLDLNVEKYWARNYESFGEDPFLASKMAYSSVRGTQGDYKTDRTRVATCMKHFIGYGATFNGKDRSNRIIPDNWLMEYYAPAFQAAISAGSATAMTSYTSVNGEEIVQSEFYLKWLIREQMKFKGMLVTDWQEIESQHLMYGTSPNNSESTRISMQHTTIDMSMVPSDSFWSDDALALVKAGVIKESRLDESVARVLQLKKDLGLFEQPYSDPALLNLVGSPQDVEAARNAVRESITLLKNANGVLPLKTSENVLFLGAGFNSTRYMSGGWNVHWQGPTEEEGDAVYAGFGDSVLKGLETVLGQAPMYLEGFHIDGNVTTDAATVLAAAQKADKIVIAVGEHTYAEIPGDINELDLYPGQLEFVRNLASQTSVPVVLVLIEGRPRLLNDLPDLASGIINAYLPGAYGGLPIAEVLYGKVNPSGRQPFTYPKYEFQHTTTILQGQWNEYLPQWQFGFGLGYSDIKYSNLKTSSDSLSPGKPITVSVSVTNNGPYPQLEPVLLSTRQQYRRYYQPEVHRLRAFTKVQLAVGETKQVSFDLAAEEMEFWARDLKKRIEPGAVNVTLNPWTPNELVTVVDLYA